MILAHSNRSLSYLLSLIILMTLGCSGASTNHFALNTVDKDGVILNQKINKKGLVIVKNKDESLTITTQEVTKPDSNESHLKLTKRNVNNSLIKVIKKEPKVNLVKAKAKNRAKKTFKKRTQKKSTKKKSGGKSIWNRMFSLYALPDIDNQRVNQEIKRFLKHPKHLVQIQHRAEPYLHLVMDEIEAKKIPGEIALLPIIESAYKPTVTSSASAAGLWQFIPSTGLSFGLKQNWWYDGRRDVYASTQAATRYLKKLSKSFKGDWFLALASYNVGIGNVKKAIKKNGKQDYWALELPKETQDYVPKLLALAKLFANAEKYNLPLKSIPNKPFFQVVNIKSPLDLKKAAEMANMKFNDFFVLNPAFNRTMTPPDGPHRLLVNINHAKTFKRKLAKLPQNKRVDWVKHKIKEGEDLKMVAKQHKTSIKNLLKVNKLGKKEIKKIGIGKILKIPPASIKTLVKSQA